MTDSGRQQAALFSGRSCKPLAWRFQFAGLESFVCSHTSLLLAVRSYSLPETIYDVAIIGSGPAGYTAAIRAGQWGMKTELIEKDGFLAGACHHAGGTYTNSLLVDRAACFQHTE